MAKRVISMIYGQKCIYCGKEITKRSSEHIIQNALGGLLESSDICCPECNNYISQGIDAPFTKIFNPIISQITNFSKSNNPKSMPSYTGKVIYEGKLYTANIKGNKVVGCPELSRELRCDISKLPLQIFAYDFNVDDTAFKQGIAKIAFNYAMSQNVDFDYIKAGLKVDKSGHIVNSIKYDYKLVPFFPLNIVDSCIELGTISDVYHNLILFSQHNCLWCYVDLFNTFQYYVLLSETIPDDKTIYANYAQTLRKLDRDISFLSDRLDYKDIASIARQYGVEPSMDMKVFSARIKNVVNSKSQKIPLEELISPRIKSVRVQNIMSPQHDISRLKELMIALQMYLDEEENLQEQNFRTITPGSEYLEVFSYPYLLAKTLAHDQEKFRTYATKKFKRLNQFLALYSR